jgi:tRNA1(Val) A37 N6-methylase TrmN6
MITEMGLEKTLETAAKTIYRNLAEDLGEDLQDRVDEWCELHGLERLDKPLLIVARQAAFNTLLKATLYERYHQRDILPELDSELSNAFQNAQETTLDPAFGDYLLDDVANVIDEDELEELLKARHKLEESHKPAEEIGRLFESLVPQESRRKLGQFRTPPIIADLMASWVVETGDQKVLDPGMGAGALSAATYRAKQQKSEVASLSDIHGTDLNELALVMGATSLTLLNQDGRHNLKKGDFLNLNLDDVDGKVDSIISNPPYSRHHELSEGYKERVNSQAEDELGRNVSALSPMYAYFYYHSAKFLNPGGRLSFITPSEFLETSYGETLKQYLIDEYNIKGLVLFDREDSSKFDEAMTTSLVSFVEKSDGNETDELTRFVRVDGDPNQETLLEAINGDLEGDTEWGFINAVRQNDLIAEDKWTNLFDPLDINTSGLTELSELATVNRGIATGKNDYFCLNQSEVEEWDIDEKYLSKIIRNSRSVPGYDYRIEDWEQDREDNIEVWVLYHLKNIDPENFTKILPDKVEGNATLRSFEGQDSETNGSPGLIKYLEYGMSDEVEAHNGYLARNRNPWFVVDRRDPPTILVTYMSRDGSRFILNETNARYLSNLHGIYLDVDMTERQIKALLAYLNCEFASKVVRRSGRTYSSGMDKIEPNEMESVPVLDPRGLPDETVRDLAILFETLREAARNGKEVDAVIDKIDERLADELEE